MWGEILIPPLRRPDRALGCRGHAMPPSRLQPSAPPWAGGLLFSPVGMPCIAPPRVSALAELDFVSDVSVTRHIP